MSRFSTRFRRTGASLLVREFGELVVYYPSGGTDGRPIRAKIERNVGIPSETGQQVAYAFRITVLDSSVDGIAATEINTQLDEIEFATIAGGDTERRSISFVPDDSNGLVRLMVR